jgi:flotillin
MTFLYLIAGVVIVLVVLFIVLTSLIRWRVAPPNVALIVSGGVAKRPKIVVGGGLFVSPIFQNVGALSLNLREAQLRTDCRTQQGVPVTIIGVAIYKIGNDEASITNAASRFLGQDAQVMDRNMTGVLDGHLRAIVSTLTMDKLYSDREALVAATLSACSDQMQALGLVIDALPISDVIDPTDFIGNIAAPHIAEVKQLARVAEANNNRIATEAEQAAQNLVNAAKRDTSIKAAEYQASIDTATAKSKQQGPLADATAQQEVVVAQTQVQKLEADRVEQELQVTVRRPADANAYAVRTTAEGARDAAISAAEAIARQTVLRAQAEAEATTVTGTADGAATTARGLAEAAVNKAKLVAEADGIKARSDALAVNPESVINQQMTELLPLMIEKAAAPFASISQLTVLDGAEGMNKAVASIISSAVALLPVLSDAAAKFRKSQV